MKRHCILALVCLMLACLMTACVPVKNEQALQEAVEQIEISLLQDPAAEPAAQAPAAPVQQEAAEEPEAEAGDSLRTVEVSTVDELLAAIAPGTRIVLAPGSYLLTEASDYGSEEGGAYYRWEDVYDGYQLVLEGIDQLSICGAGVDSTRIETTPRYANVLYFQNSSGIRVSGLMAGHTDGQGECGGGVLYFSNCSQVSVEDSALYGCGVWGISGDYCKDIRVSDTRIYSCSDSAGNFYCCQRVLLKDCSMDQLPFSKAK